MRSSSNVLRTESSDRGFSIGGCWIAGLLAVVVLGIRPAGAIDPPGPTLIFPNPTSETESSESEDPSPDAEPAPLEEPARLSTTEEDVIKIADPSPTPDPEDAAAEETAQEPPTTQPPTEEPPITEPPITEPPIEQPQPVGERLAPGIVRLVQNEIAAGLKGRNIESKFVRFRNYAGAKLNATARPRTGSELTGNCRLDWYDHLLRNPISAPAEAEEFTRTLHQAVLSQRDSLGRTLAIAADRLDLSSDRPTPEAVDSPEAALQVIERALIESQLAYAMALSPLSRSEIQTLKTNLYPILTSQNKVGHTLRSRSSGRRLCDIMEKMDRNAMHRAAEVLAPIADPQLLAQLKMLPTDRPVAVTGTTGTMVGRIDTPGGAIVIGGPGQNTYKLDEMADVSVVIDLGGNDAYFEGRVSTRRPVLIVIDLGGNDGYRGEQPGVQGAGLLGVSMLLDLDGDDIYQAKDVAQGSCVAGAGILIDYAGNDTYIGLRRVQGEAIGGVGILIDRGGNDRYHAAMWAQGFGGPLGFGLLDDLDGQDHYYGGGLYVNSYIDDDDNPTPGYEGWSQGVGAGLRAVSNGGIGVILDGGGDDIYEYDYLSHGGGYWCGTGFARDFGGNDQRLGATRKAYNGSARSQRRFQRFSNGFGCHYALGFLFDDQGDDTYNGTIMCLGFAWDCAAGYLMDFGGNDTYSGTQGNGAQAGFGVLFDYDGDDNYLGYRQGRASAGISYHDLPNCGGNFGFVIDYGGTDKYGCGAKNNSYLRRSSSGGFLIDRPKAEPVALTAKKPATPIPTPQ